MTTVGNGRFARWVLAAIGVTLIVIAGFLALRRVYTYDSSCGTVFYDTANAGSHNARVCSHSLAVQRAWTGGVALSALLLLVVPFVVDALRLRDLTRIVAIALALTAFALFLVGLNRVLQPYDGSETCGSPVNRVTYEATHDRLCGHLLWPQERAAMLGFGAGTITGAVALVLFARSRRAAGKRGSTGMSTTSTLNPAAP